VDILPTFITHYYWGKHEMLKNLCNLPLNEAEIIIANLRSSGKRVWLHSGYLKDRHRVEEWLYHEFENKGKKPRLRHPLYFVLGENNDFFSKNGFFSDKEPAKLQLPLAIFTSDMISFAYPDSMTSLNLVSPPPPDTYELRPREDGQMPTLEEIDEEMRRFAESYRKPQHGQVFTLSEIADVVKRYGMPGTKWQSEPQWRIDRYIEAQVWDERPIWELLSTNTLDCNDYSKQL